MNEDNESRKSLSLAEQLEAIRKFADQYNSDGMHTLQKTQLAVNKNWLELLRKQQSLAVENPTDLTAHVLELSAAEVLRKAHIEGEIHIFEHHRSSPILFYFEKKGKDTHLMMYKDLKTHNLGTSVWTFAELLLRNSGVKEVRLSSFFAIEKGADIELNCFFLGLDQTIMLRTSCFLNKNKKYDLKEVIRLSESNTYFGLGSWFFHAHQPPTSNEIWFLATNTSTKKTIIDRWRSASSQNRFTLTTTHTSKILPRFAGASPQNNREFYVIDGEVLRLNSAVSAKNKTLLTKNEINPPIGIAYHEVHDSVLVRTTTEIGIYFPNQPAKPTWRSFGDLAVLPLPDRSITSGVTFTLSCLLRFRPKPTGAYPPPPVEGKPNALTHFGFWIENNELIIQYTTENTLHLNSTTGKLEQAKPNPEVRVNLGILAPKITEPRWFQLAIVKDGTWFTVYIDGKKVHAVAAPEHIYTESGINLCCPGYMMAELRIWNKTRNAAELAKYSRTWLPSTEFDGLTAYWHLYVLKDKNGLVLEHVNDKGELDLIQEPDLSGHNRHLIAQRAGIRQPGDLNYHTYTVDTAESPFPKFIPLYALKTDIQNFELDPSTGRIFWSDKNAKNEVVLFAGSALGHARPTVLIASDMRTDFALISQTNDLHEELILLHAKRRNLIESVFFGTRDDHRNDHKTVEEAHQKLDETLTKQVNAREKTVAAGGDYKQHYLEIHEKWQETIMQMHHAENELRIALQNTRLDALEEARIITQTALHDVHASRHPETDNL